MTIETIEQAVERIVKGVFGNEYGLNTYISKHHRFGLFINEVEQLCNVRLVGLFLSGNDVVAKVKELRNG